MWYISSVVIRRREQGQTCEHLLQIPLCSETFPSLGDLFTTLKFFLSLLISAESVLIHVTSTTAVKQLRANKFSQHCLFTIE